MRLAWHIAPAQARQKPNLPLDASMAACSCRGVRTLFTLAHLSDPHVGPLPKVRLAELMSKRLTGYWNWHRGRHRAHDMPTLKAIMADIVALKPDHVALTGDLVNIGLASEFPAAAQVLKPLGGPDFVSIVPGNHDVYVRGSYAAMERSFGPFMRGDDLGETQFPYMRMRQGFALIGLCSGIPTAPLLASGALGPQQCEALRAMLAAAGQGGLIRVVMIHHPPLATGATFGRGLRDAKAFEAVLRMHGAELVLHGHNHSRSLHWFQSRGKPAIPVIGVASASAVPGTPRHRAEHHLYRFEDHDGVLRIHMTTRQIDAHGAIHTGHERLLTPP
jgi:3',5'-cyclic AMP phosphodiesterase CpdA